VGETVVIAVVVGDEAVVLEDDASGLASPPQPASNNKANTIELSANETTSNDAAAGAALRAATRASRVFLTDALCPI